jgi:phosphonate transport system substrate-binding protein
MMRRRDLLAGFLATGVSGVLGMRPAYARNGPLRIGITPVFLDNQTGFVDRWGGYLENRLGRSIAFQQRSTYRQIIDLLLDGELDFAWICGYPYLRFRHALKLVSVPLYQGEPLYQSYLIVGSEDRTTGSISDLKGRIFAYSDPDSNSGFLVTQSQIEALGENRETFFRKSFFTWAHEKVISAVAAGLADGGAVDGYIWDTLAKRDPTLTGRTRIIGRSRKFGFPPIVASRSTGDDDTLTLQRVLIEMSVDPEGRTLLGELNLDGFSRQDNALFDGIGELINALSMG